MSTETDTPRAGRAPLRETSRPGGPQAHPLNMIVVASIAALGGLLFGYDTGVISGAELFLTKAFHLSATTEELAVSAVLIGAIVGAAAAGRLANALGRKVALIVLAAVFALGAVLTALAPALPWFVAFRIVVGLGVGGAWDAVRSCCGAWAAWCSAWGPPGSSSPLGPRTLACCS